jgi:uncharacterized UPF0146 family protein
MYKELVNNKIKEIGVSNNTYSYGYIENLRLNDGAIEKIVDFLSNKFSNKIKMCDLGIGFGKKIYQISHKLKERGFDVEVHGVEINDKYFDTIMELKNEWEVDLILHKMDVMYFDISDFDFIYLFQPLKNIKPLYEKICDNMKSGSIIFDPSFQSVTIKQKLKKYIVKDNDYKFYLWEK